MHNFKKSYCVEQILKTVSSGKVILKIETILILNLVCNTLLYIYVLNSCQVKTSL